MTSTGFAILLLLLTGVRAAQAQRATLSGTVVADSTRLPLAGAEATVPALSKRALTDAAGRFVLTHIAPGRHEVVVRHLGYRPLVAWVTFADGPVEREFALQRVPLVLDTVSVRRSAIIPSFEEHRALGLGSFITREELAKQEGRKLSEVIAQLRGIRITPGPTGRAYVESSRRTRGFMEPEPCYPQVYLNDQLIYYGRRGEPPFDINSVLVGSVEAIEFYAGPASTPSRYSKLNSDCGVLVLHTRRSP